MKSCQEAWSGRKDQTRWPPLVENIFHVISGRGLIFLDEDYFRIDGSDTVMERGVNQAAFLGAGAAEASLTINDFTAGVARRNKETFLAVPVEKVAEYATAKDVLVQVAGVEKLYGKTIASGGPPLELDPGCTQRGPDPTAAALALIPLSNVSNHR